MSPDTLAAIGYILAAFVVGLLTHRGDIGKAVQKDIEKRLAAPAASAPPTPTTNGNTLALHSTVTSVDLLAQLVADLRGDFEADRADRLREMAEIRRRLPPENEVIERAV